METRIYDADELVEGEICAYDGFGNVSMYFPIARAIVPRELTVDDAYLRLTF
jgi:hypothetical protein